MIRCCHTRIDLNGELAIFRQVESFRDCIEQFFNLTRLKKRWSTAAPMHLRYDPLMRKLNQVHFFNEILNVSVGGRMILLDDYITSAIQAQPLAKRDVHVNGERSRRLSQRRYQESSTGGLPVRGRWIARVARSRRVITFH